MVQVLWNDSLSGMNESPEKLWSSSPRMLAVSPEASASPPFSPVLFEMWASRGSLQRLGRGQGPMCVFLWNQPPPSHIYAILVVSVCRKCKPMFVSCLCLQRLPPAVTCHEKVVSVRKDPSESLGMTVSGGASHSEWDLPIYVISVEPGGVISRDGRIKTGNKEGT